MSPSSTIAGPAVLHSRKPFILVGVLGIVCALLGGVSPWAPARIPAGLLLVLVLPGYAASGLLLKERRAATVEFPLLVLGGSLVISILSGLALYLLPGNMTRHGWAAILGASVVVLALASALDVDEYQFARGTTPSSRRVSLRVGWRPAGEAVIALAALCVLILAVSVAVRGADKATPFMELSAITEHGGPRGRVIVRLRSHSRETVALLVAVVENGRPTRTKAVRLAPGQRWMERIVPSATTGRLAVRVYHSGAQLFFLHTVTYLPDALPLRRGRASNHPHRRRPAGETRRNANEAKRSHR